MDSNEQRQDEPRGRPAWLLDGGILLTGGVLFAGFLYVLMAIHFPAGTRLGSGGRAASADASRDAPRQIEYARGDKALVDLSSVVGELTDIRQNVKVKTADTVAWLSARTGMDIMTRDAVQTLSRSQATIELADHGELVLVENSLVVFQEGAEDVFLGSRRPSLVMVEGELSGRLRPAGDESVRLALGLPNGMVRLASDSPAEGLEFAIRVNPDRSSTVQLYSGEAIVNTESGEQYRIDPDQGLTIGADGRSAGSTRLPATPGPVGPANGEQIVYAELPPITEFRWAASAGSGEARLRLARDPDFRELVLDRRITGNTFRFGNFAPGRYYWQVSAVDGWHESAASPVRTLDVIRDTRPPDLEVIWPDGSPSDPWIRGRAERGSQVRVAGHLVAVQPGGNFEHELRGLEGTRVITVEAIDAAGNAAYESRLVAFATAAGNGVDR